MTVLRWFLTLLVCRATTARISSMFLAANTSLFARNDLVSCRFAILAASSSLSCLRRALASLFFAFSSVLSALAVVTAALNFFFFFPTVLLVAPPPPSEVEEREKFSPSRLSSVASPFLHIDDDDPPLPRPPPLPPPPSPSPARSDSKDEGDALVFVLKYSCGRALAAPRGAPTPTLTRVVHGPLAPRSRR